MSSMVEHMKSFLEHKKKLDDYDRNPDQSENGDSYEKEFTKIRDMSQSFKTENIYSFVEGSKTCNLPKNRYKDIIPFDHTRVILKTQKGGATSDYINASIIKGAVGDQVYIAAQGPLPNTVNDFWQMIWENNIKVIIMACREYEEDSTKLKCQRYWPDSATEKQLTFGDIVVTLEKEEGTKYKEHVIRHMTAKLGDQIRKVVQLHHCDWHDLCAVNDVESVLHLIERMRQMQPLDAKETPPVLVHCSAGCGRTGSILVIDYVLSLLKYGNLTPRFRLYDVIVEMRRQRMALVQTLLQYIFVHEAVALVFNRQLKQITTCEYEITTPPTAKRPEKMQKPVKKPPLTPRTSNSKDECPLERSPEAINVGLYQQVKKVSGATKTSTSTSSNEVEYEEIRPELPHRGYNIPDKDKQTAPPIVKKEYEEIKSLPEKFTKIKSPIMLDVTQITYKGMNISFPNRISKPRGKRQVVPV